MSEQLPAGWKWSTIPDVVGENGVFVDGDWIESKDQDPKGDVRLIQLADIGDGNFRNKSARFLTLKRATEIKCTFLSDGDILVARMPDPIGRACIFPLKGKDKYVTAVDVAIIRPDNNIIDSKYLLYSINNPKYRNAIEDLESGTTRKRISRKNLSTLQFSLPSKSTQQAIVSKIEELFSELDKGIENLRLAQQQLKTYRQSVLKWAFEGRLTNENVTERELPVGWAMVKLKNLIDKMRSGSQVPPSNEISQYPILRSSSVRSSKIDLNDIKYVQHIQKIKTDDYIASGDLLFTRLNGSVEYVGNCAKVPEIFPANLIYPDRIFRLRLLNPEYGSYIMHFFATNIARKEIEANAKSTAGHMRISTSDIADMMIPLCSVLEQKEIVQAIESRLSVADKMEESIIQSLQHAEALRQSILKNAFEGRLI